MEGRGKGREEGRESREEGERRKGEGMLWEKTMLWYSPSLKEWMAMVR